MRVLFMSDRYPPYYEGGYEINCEAAAKALEGKGHETFILTSMYGMDKPVVDGNVYRVLHTLDNDKGRGARRRINHLRNAYLSRVNYRLALRVVREARPDVVFVWRMGHVSIFPVRAANALRVPVVYRLGDFWLKEYVIKCVKNPSPLKRLYWFILGGGYHFSGLDFTNMISISRALKKEYVGLGFPQENFTIISPGVQRETVREEIPERLRCPGRGLKLIYAGRLVEKKGVHIAVEAVTYLVNMLKVKDVQLDIVGNGPEQYLRALNEKIDAFGLRDHVTVKNQVPRRELIDSYRGYDALLFTSLWEEPFGMTTIEAMSQGLPVIASRVGALPEIIAHGENGMLVPPDDPVKLAETVHGLIKDPALTERLSSAGIRTVLERYTHERAVDRLEDYLYSAFRKGESGALREVDGRHAGRQAAASGPSQRMDISKT